MPSLSNPVVRKSMTRRGAKAVTSETAHSSISLSSNHPLVRAFETVSDNGFSNCCCQISRAINELKNPAWAGKPRLPETHFGSTEAMVSSASVRFSIERDDDLFILEARPCPKLHRGSKSDHYSQIFFGRFNQSPTLSPITRPFRAGSRRTPDRSRRRCNAPAAPGRQECGPTDLCDPNRTPLRARHADRRWQASASRWL